MPNSKMTATVTGNLATRPEMHSSKKGNPYGTFTIAVSPRVQDQNGNWKDLNDQPRLVNCVTFDPETATRLVNTAADANRGIPLTVTGDFRVHDVIARDGHPYTRLELTMNARDTLSQPIRMHGSSIKATLEGNLIAPPEVLMSQKGNEYARMAIAVNQRWKTQNGWEDVNAQATIVNVTVFDPNTIANLVRTYGESDGKLAVQVTGNLVPRDSTNKTTGKPYTRWEMARPDEVTIPIQYQAGTIERSVLAKAEQTDQAEQDYADVPPFEDDYDDPMADAPMADEPTAGMLADAAAAPAQAPQTFNPENGITAGPVTQQAPLQQRPAGTPPRNPAQVAQVNAAMGM